MRVRKSIVGALSAVVALNSTLGLSNAFAGEQRWIDEPMSQWLSQVLYEPVTEGNEVEFLVDGTEFWPARQRMIKNARAGDTIDLVTFLWCDDETGLTAAGELAAAAQRGVRVRVIIDKFNNKPHEQAYAIMRNGGVYMQIFDNGLNYHNHEKMMVVNGYESLVGGSNLCNEYMIGGDRKLWHDLELRVKGPISARIQTRYDETWNWLAGVRRRIEAPVPVPALPDTEHANDALALKYPLFGPTPIQVPQGGERPGGSKALLAYQRSHMYKGEGDRYRTAFSELVKRARREVVIYDAYVVPPIEFENAMIQTAKRGVKVSVVTNSKSSNDMGDVFNAAMQGYYARLISSGIKVYEYQPRTLHAKAILIDDVALLVGSHNFTMRSFYANGESDILVGDGDAIAKYQRMFAYDLAHDTKEVTWADVQQLVDKPKDSFFLIIGRWFSHLF